ncbi:MbtH family NRPS accessory protein [Kosakonia quasisacchari]|uniref:MbtH family NRPS accessory protein n=1 Tax=Kosakonia quasisacchari TaxID=2529380 RepID=A0A4R0HGN2_9ENTR|nr:MbtH family NRPS accessory protein [Kosakonia quasisacchari]TCC09268.1 MbtH family NRPS accessory protein [Kosakonia quasisacchari]
MTSTNLDENWLVVVNSEEQYSVWPARLALPDGWMAVGEYQSKENCLQWIENNWIDMRPLSLRKHLDARN